MTSTEMETIKITPEVLQELLQYYNLTRQEFIHTYNIQPLVYVPELPTGAKATFVLIYTLIFMLALMGNSLVVCVVVKKGSKQSATSIFICSLAISDLLITFFCIPFTLLQNISAQWFGGNLYLHDQLVARLLFVMIWTRHVRSSYREKKACCIGSKNTNLSSCEEYF